MSTTASRMTVEEFYAVTVEGDRKQLVEGELVVNDPKLIHALLQERLGYALGAWVRARRDRGQVFWPTDVRLDQHNVYGPDLIWFAEAHVPADLDGYPDPVPDLCVEIRSQSTWQHDVGAKKRVYEAWGLPELWLVDDAAETVLVYRRSAPESKLFDVELELRSGQALTSPQLPSFSLALDELFER